MNPAAYRALLRDAHGAEICAWLAQIGSGAVAPDPPPPTPSSLALRLDFTDGKTLSFSQAAATDVGDYAGAFVHQKCYRQRASGNGDYRDGFVVFFRPDADGNRDEIVVEYGSELDCSASPPKLARNIPVAHCGAYTATISGGSLPSPVQYSLTNHWLRARWRWQSAPRPLVRSYADLVGMKAILPLDVSLRYGAPLPPKTVWKGPMDTGGLMAGMGTTGDRPDIGPITEWQAAWLLTGGADCERAWRAGAEATGTMPFFIRDATTGNLVDIVAHPYLAYKSVAAQYQIPDATLPPLSTPNYFRLDASHMPAAGWVSWLLTDDPYFLEGAQAAAHYGSLESNYRKLNETPHLPGLANTSQTRGFAWSLRDISRLARLAPESAPSWLQPRSYWQSLFPDTLAYARKYINSATKQCAVFGLITETNFISPIMIDYLCVVLGEIGWSSAFPEWDEVVRYAAIPRLAMADSTGQSGWDARFPSPYNIPLQNARQKVSTLPPNGNYSSPSTADTPDTWGELFSCICVILGLDPSTWAADTIIDYQKGYVPDVRAALAALSLAGVPDARARHDWIKSHLDRQWPVAGGAAFKWAIPPA